MNIADIFKEETVFSFEVFPPKKESGVETVYNTLKELKGKICMEFSVPMTNVNVTTKFFSMSDKHYCFIYASMYSDKLYSETICVEVV